MLEEIKNKIGQNLILLIIQFLLNYIKYFFLTGSVIFSIILLLFILFNINPNFSFDFLKYFAFINPTYKSGTFSMGIKEVMQIFSVISLILLIIASLIKIILKRLFNLNLLISLKLRVILVFAIITISYIFAFFIVAFSEHLDKGFYFVFVIFYITNLFFILFYFLFDALKIEIRNSSNSD